MRVTILGIIAASLVAGITAYFFANPLSGPAAVGASTNSQTSAILFDANRILELLKALLTARTPTPTLQLSTSTPVATSTPVIKTATTTKAVTKPKTVSPPSTETRLGLLLPSLRSALVNIICIPVPENGLRGISGSGVIIDSRGIILTAAHVAQYTLLAEARPDIMNCVVRTGSPASNTYLATPVYVSSRWIKENAKAISSNSPTGTGENDYALLAITGTATSTPIASSFASVPLASSDPKEKDPIVIGTYGAEFQTSERIRSGIFPTLVYGSVKDRYTFNTQSVDLISLGGGAAAQEGSSGGGAMNINGQLIGLITTSSTGTDIQTRDLRAITAPYLRRAFKEESGTSIETYLDRISPSELAKSYVTQAKTLASQLVKANHL